MANLAENLTGIFFLLGTASFMIVVALIFTDFKFFKRIETKKSLIAKVAVGVLMGALAIFATLSGMKLQDGTNLNVRELAPMIAGVTGGPIGGAIAGLIGGIHRYTLGGTTQLPCSIATICVGIVAGLVSTKLTGKYYLVKAAVLGLVLESSAMALIPLFVPLDRAIAIVQEVAPSMITANTVGLVLWVYLSNKWKQNPNEN
jgi:sigma-B regulation protein RsbU (phosphoserine phosphatase)